MALSLSDKIRHFFHVVSNIRPIVWIGLYVALTPIFATIYWALPDGQFRIPDNAGTDWGSWLYYSIVTITTLGFGDYTPAHGWAQAITAIEVMCGLIFLGFFLNAVGSMKSEIDVESEIEMQHKLHFSLEKEKLVKSAPAIFHALNVFLDYCYAVTTPLSIRKSEEGDYNPDFKFNDMADLFESSGLPTDKTGLPAVKRLMKSASHTSLTLDSLQTRVDLTLWPDLLEDCFTFVANCQMFANTDVFFSEHPEKAADSDRAKSLEELIKNYSGDLSFKPSDPLQPVGELYFFIKENAATASKIETVLTTILKE